MCNFKTLKWVLAYNQTFFYLIDHVLTPCQKTQNKAKQHLVENSLFYGGLPHLVFVLENLDFYIIWEKYLSQTFAAQNSL